MSSKRITNLATLGIDLIYGCLIAFIALFVLSRVASMTSLESFNKEVSANSGTYNDFRSYYASGKIAASSERANLFTQTAQKEFFLRYSTPPGATGEDWSLIPYAPFFAIAMSILSQLQLNLAFVAWTFGGMLALLIALPLLAHARLERPSVYLAPLTFVGMLATLPLVRCVILGQASMVITALVALFFLCWMRREDVSAGILMALSTFKPQFVPLTLVPALAKQKWKMLTTFVVTEVVLWGGATLWLGPKPLLDYIPFVVNQGSGDWNQKFTMLSLRSIFSYLPKTFELGLSAVCCLIGMGCVFWLWRGKRDLDRSVESCWLIASNILIFLLTSIYTQLYDALLLVICAVLTLPFMGLKNLSGTSLQHKVWWVIFYSYPILSWGLWLSLGRTNHFTYHWYTLGLMILTPLAVSRVLRLRAASPASPAADESLQ